MFLTCIDEQSKAPGLSNLVSNLYYRWAERNSRPFKHVLLTCLLLLYITHITRAMYCCYYWPYPRYTACCTAHRAAMSSWLHRGACCTAHRAAMSSWLHRGACCTAHRAAMSSWLHREACCTAHRTAMSSWLHRGACCTAYRAAMSSWLHRGACCTAHRAVMSSWLQPSMRNHIPYVVAMADCTHVRCDSLLQCLGKSFTGELHQPNSYIRIVNIISLLVLVHLLSIFWWSFYPFFKIVSLDCETK